jgi:predicted permease
MTRERQHSQQVLVAAQLALALLLLVGAGLMIRSFQALRSVIPGFTEPERVQTFSMSIPATVVSDPAIVTRMQHQILDSTAAIPGVSSAAFTTRLPMGSGRSSSALLVEVGQDAQPPAPNRAPPNRQIKIVSPGSFQTLGTPLVAGRDFTWTDVHDMRDVAMVSENLARELFGSPEAALGRRIRELYHRNARWQEIVGVAGDVHDDGVDRPTPPTVYWPVHADEHILSDYEARRVSFAVRTDRAGTAGLMDRVREAVASVSATLPIAQIRTLDDLYRRSMARTSFTLVMLGIAAIMAALLAVSGIYGVTAYAVSQRRREVGIRQALGAQPSDIQWLFLRRGLVLVGVGTAIGLGSAVSVTRLIESLIFGTSPRDPIAFAATSFVLATVAMLATYLPIRRAVASPPVETLREG